jgi:hypothetical protein
MYQAASSTADAIHSSIKHSKNTSPFAARFGVSIYDYYQQHPEKADRFGLGMKGAMKCKSICFAGCLCFAANPASLFLWLVDKESLVDLQNCYPWAQFAGGTVVDVGGGTGHVSRFLAKV